MINVTNLTNRTISITDTIKVSPFDNVDVDYEIDNRLYQLKRMGLIKLQEINNQPSVSNQTNAVQSQLFAKRQAVLNKVKEGQIKQQSLPLHTAVLSGKDQDKTIKRKRKS